ncbi:MAG: hypothetical protein JO246_01140 [Frankiaceae bacterium]|nr:hypothetical protein [Frankiaceae bacterium]MBV9869818.1 hypothetical protein [Frankiaceae bacterium]
MSDTHPPVEPNRSDVDAPGDAQSVPVPHDDAQENSSETFAAVDGVRQFPESEPDPS